MLYNLEDGEEKAYNPKLCLKCYPMVPYLEAKELPGNYKSCDSST